MKTIQQELRKPAHYLSMGKREQAANHIDEMQTLLNRYSADEVRLTHQSTIAAQAEQIEALTQQVQAIAQPVQPASPTNFAERCRVSEQCLPNSPYRAALEKLHVEMLDGLIAQPVQQDLKALVQKVHKAKGRHHNQIAMCDLYDACGLSNVRPTKETL